MPWSFIGKLGAYLGNVADIHRLARGLGRVDEVVELIFGFFSGNDWFHSKNVWALGINHQVVGRTESVGKVFEDQWQLNLNFRAVVLTTFENLKFFNSFFCLNFFLFDNVFFYSIFVNI